MTAESLAHDLWYALRSALRRPGTTAVLLLSLALGTGANAAVFGVVRRLVLAAPAGVEGARHLVNVYTSEFSAATHGPSSYADFLSMAGASQAFASLAAIDDHAVENVRRGNRGSAIRISRITGAFFATLRLSPDHGRLLTADDAATDAAVAVVSQPLAEQLGGGAIVGDTITIGGGEYTVVGVTPERFRGLQVGRESDVWIPLTRPSDRRGDRRLALIGRLASGQGLRAATDELQRLSDDLAARYPATNRGNKDRADAPRRFTPVRYSQLDPAAGDQVFVISVVVGGAAALLLASACLNVGSLLLSSAVARRGEFAVKMALGASRARLIQQLLVEALVMSLAGGVLGLLFASWTTTAMPALFMVEQAEQLDTRLDASALALTIGVATLAGAIFGIAPAIHGTSSPAATALRADAGNAMNSPGATRLRAWLVGSQVTLSTALLLGAGLAVSSLTDALQAGLGATTRRVAFVSVELPGRFGDPLRGIAFRNALLEQLAGLPSVEAVGWSSKLPVSRAGKQQFAIEGGTDVNDAIELDTNVVTPEYFRVLLLQLVEGRLFEPAGGPRATPVIVVDELLAQRYLGASAVGRHLVDVKGTRLEIVGVVRSGRYRTLQQAPQPTVYYAVSQEYLYQGHALVRLSADPGAILPALGAAVRQAGRGGAAFESATLDDYLGKALAIDRLITTLIGLSGVIALAMSAVGIYGVMTDTVRRRTREIGLRVALGARHTQIARVVFGESMRLAVVGLLGGLGLALVGMAAARTLLFGVPALDLITLGGVTAALVAVIALAAVLPLREALRVSPMIALRAE